MSADTQPPTETSNGSLGVTVRTAAKIAELVAKYPLLGVDTFIPERDYNQAENHRRELVKEVERLNLRLRCSAPEPGGIPDVLFDGYSVLKALDDHAVRRTSAENVSDVLDAVVKLLRGQREPCHPTRATLLAFVESIATYDRYTHDDVDEKQILIDIENAAKKLWSPETKVDKGHYPCTPCGYAHPKDDPGCKALTKDKQHD